MKESMLLVLCLLYLEGCFSLREFFNGRQQGGNVGLPGGEDLDLSSGADKYERWFTQNLDHFSPSDERTWQQRYFVNDEFAAKSRNVAFLNIGGEGPASSRWMEKGTWIDYAKHFNAICFQLEHRYYGESRPTEDLSTSNLKYLSSQQALADLAVFIKAMTIKYELSPDVKWIAFGGSYSGSLSAWLRMKYPHLVHGAMSASSPILAELNFKEYFRVVANDLRDISDACVTAVKQAFAEVELLLRHPVGQKNLNELFNLCDPIDQSIHNADDVANFYSTLADNFAGVAQYNLDNRIPSGKSKVTLNTVCDVMTNQTLGPEVQRLAALNRQLKRNQSECTDYKYENMISEMRNVSWGSDAAEGSRQWVYQTCTEFGYYQTSEDKPHIFGTGFPLKFSVQQCRDIYDDEYNITFLDNAIERSNTIYGGLDIDVTNVVFVHGTVDPWHMLGITKTRENLAPAILIKGTAHCANMYPEAEDDLPQLKAARVQVKQLIETWLDL